MFKGTLRQAKKIKEFLKKEDKKLGFSSTVDTVPALLEDCISHLEQHGIRIPKEIAWQFEKV